MAVIRTQNLTKRYKDLLAVDNVNLKIESGECFGLLGPNGAGKTTLIRMITAVSPPTSGDIWVQENNLRTHSRQVKAILGVVPQLDNLDPDLTVLKNLLVFARYFDIPRNEALQRSTEVLKLLQLEEKHRSKINELSGGMKRRLLIARGLINMPKIIILDEPTIGLDPQSKYLVWNKLSELKSQGIVQLLCTQNMEEANVLCDRVAIMHQGRILALDTPRRLIQIYIGNEIWEIGINSDEKNQTLDKLKRRGIDFEVVGDRVHLFHVDSFDSIRELLMSPDRIWRRAATLEDVFFKLTGRSLNE